MLRLLIFRRPVAQNRSSPEHCSPRMPCSAGRFQPGIAGAERAAPEGWQWANQAPTSPGIFVTSSRAAPYAYLNSEKKS